MILGTTNSPHGSPSGEEVYDLKAQLREAQKLAVLGTNAAMLAHEYNNLFAPVVSYAHYALDRDDVELMRKTLRMLVQQAKTVQAMSNRIMGLVQADSEPLGAVALNHVVTESLQCLGRDLAKDNIQVEIKIDPTLRVRGNQNQLMQLFFNLATNARQAMLGRSGMLKISATPLSDQWVSIHIRDSGRGIKPNDLDKLFQPFFTTKQSADNSEKRSMGLGLTICKEIVEDHNGTISVESIEENGTTFTITLPLAEPAH